ncbi:helix-turn-helix domain-containing protein [Pseudonocardia charpentierae]|uniref:Helix-turn-helix transcriptional regulator n=1 Tax=Pseudonocardia charpentierae TaxID=3075545 RepID=A0ABU2NJB7_9PSEU|nr:helix-turn-helix transcriptional regulator [Pseudonocardia sp. DSM 45834]MDT0353989.1 helix-turn-helix transcriptional regulator [Pseudonocardia sp. DSM 45834]
MEVRLIQTDSRVIAFDVIHREGSDILSDSVSMRRQLTVELKRLRAQAGLTQREVGAALDWSLSKVIRIENGSFAISVTDTIALLQVYGVEDRSVVEDLINMARGSKYQPFSYYRDIFHADTLRYFRYESSASLVRQVELLTVPALLQAEEYSRALYACYDVPKDSVDRMIECQLERQECLERIDVELFFIVDEAAIRRPVGGENLMRKQLDRLVELSQRANVCVSLLPFEIGPHKGLRGPYTYLEFPAENDPGVVFLETLDGTLVLDAEDVTCRYLEAFFGLEKLAIPVDQFRTLS